MLTDQQGCESGRGCHGDRGRNPYHGRARGDHPYEGNNHECCGEGLGNDDAGKSGEERAPSRYGQTAMKQTGEYEPTRQCISVG